MNFVKVSKIFWGIKIQEWKKFNRDHVNSRCEYIVIVNDDTHVPD